MKRSRYSMLVPEEIEFLNKVSRLPEKERNEAIIKQMFRIRDYLDKINEQGETKRVFH